MILCAAEPGANALPPHYGLLCGGEKHRAVVDRGLMYRVNVRIARIARTQRVRGSVENAPISSETAHASTPDDIRPDAIGLH